MNRLMLAAVGLRRSLRLNGIAHVVAPSSALGRLGSAVAVTAALAGVQLGLMAAHAGSELCGSVSVCGAATGAGSGRPSSHPSLGAPEASGQASVSAKAGGSSTRTASQPPRTSATQTIAFRTFTATPSGPTAPTGLIKPATRHSSTAPTKHGKTRISAAKVRRLRHRHLVVAATRLTTSRPHRLAPPHNGPHGVDRHR